MSRRAGLLVCVGLVCVLAAFGAGSGVAGARTRTAPAPLIVGLNSQTPSMFASPLFIRLGLRYARLGVPWDVAVDPLENSELEQASAWLADARAAGITPVVDFNGGWLNLTSVPTPAQYRRAVRDFMLTFPWVRIYNPWNEPDWPVRTPLFDDPALAAAYYNTDVALCHACTVIAGDVFIDPPELGHWLKQYAANLQPYPEIWGLHNYLDVHFHRDNQLRSLEAHTHGDIWITETGVGTIWNGYTSADPMSDMDFALSMPSQSPRIKALFYYNWQAEAGNPWDTGLLTAGGHPTPLYDRFLAFAQSNS